jgi:hypothetical protein
MTRRRKLINSFRFLGNRLFICCRLSATEVRLECVGFIIRSRKVSIPAHPLLFPFLQTIVNKDYTYNGPLQCRTRVRKTSKSRGSHLRVHFKHCREMLSPKA